MTALLQTVRTVDWLGGATIYCGSWFGVLHLPVAFRRSAPADGRRHAQAFPAWGFIQGCANAGRWPWTNTR